MMQLLILSTLTGFMTLLGACGALFFGQPGKRILAFYLGLSTGIMVFVILIDLLPTAFEQGPYQAVGIGLGLGILVMMIIHLIVHSVIGIGPTRLSPNKKEFYRMGWMIALAIAFHNIPEGVAIGAGFETEKKVGLLVALSIALHNVPAGISLAVPFVIAGVRKWWIVLLTLAVSICTPIGALLGKMFFIGSSFLVAMGIAFASGAMGYIIWKEIGPTSLRHHRMAALLGMSGSIVIMYIVHFLR